METRWIWPFELLNKIGEGGMGVVYRARYVRNDRHVAVKLLPRDAAENKILLARFEREMGVLKQLDHPNIVRCFGGMCDDKQQFYAMELVEGGTLSELLNHKGQLSWETVIDYAIQMCDALHYAHERGVIHRDIKPSNFLVTKNGQLKLSDFGLVTISAGRRLTASGRTMGTAEYMSPEQIRGKPGVTKQSDLYALGCVIYEMLIGSPPFLGENQVEVMHKQLAEPAPHLVHTLLNLPLELDELVYELLAKKPEDRPESADAVSIRLKEILQPGRRYRPIDSTSFPFARRATGVFLRARKLVKTPSPWPNAFATFIQGAPWYFLTATILSIVGLVCWIGWSQANTEIKNAEKALVDHLSTSDHQSQIFAAITLGKLEHLNPATIEALRATTQNGTETVRIAALNALAHHGHQCRFLIPELNKLQRNAEVSSAVRIQAGMTIEEIKNARESSVISTILFWCLVMISLASATVGDWWMRHRNRNSIASGASLKLRNV